MDFNIQRRDSGWLRLLIVVLFSFVSAGFLWIGYKLILVGTTGSWEIVSNFKGFKLYLASLSPGILVILLGAVIISFGLPQVLKNL